MHDEHEMERLKVLCLVPKQTFVIIFSASRPGCGAPTEIITFLLLQLRTADGKHEELFIFPCACHQVKCFHYQGSCCRKYLSFPRKDRKKEFSCDSCHRTRLYEKKKKEAKEN